MFHAGGPKNLDKGGGQSVGPDSIENMKKVKISPISFLTPSFDVIFHEEFDFEGLRP